MSLWTQISKRRIYGLLFILTLAALFSPGPAADITIVFKGSIVQDDYGLSNSAQNNYGKVEAGTNRYVDRFGPVYSNRIIGYYRAVGLDDSLTAHAATADSGKIKFTVWSQAWTDTTGLGGWYWLRATGIDADKDWIAGDKNGTTGACEVTYDSCIKIGAGCTDSLDWGGGIAAGDTMGFEPGADSAQITAATIKGSIVTLGLHGNQIEAMRAPDANNGWAVMVSSKPGNISAATSFYASETIVTGYADSIPEITIYAHTAAAGSTPPRRRIVQRAP